MIVTTQSNDPIVVLDEQRYMQLLEAESKLEATKKDCEKFIRQFSKALANLASSKGAIMTIDEVIKMEMPDYQILDFPKYSVDNPQGDRWNSGYIEWIKKTK